MSWAPALHHPKFPNQEAWLSVLQSGGVGGGGGGLSVASNFVSNFELYIV